jgi:AbrB family looped-hinge helix DNA binding protein
MGENMQTTISSKFQVVIPKAARERLKLRPNQKLTVIEKDGMLILLPQMEADSLRGIAAGAKLDDYRDKKDRH